MARCGGASRRRGPHARMYAPHRDLGDLHSAPAVEPGPQREGEPKPEMNGVKKSDGAIVPSKRANKGGEPLRSPWREGPRPRGNPRSESTHRTQCRESVTQAAETGVPTATLYGAPASGLSVRKNTKPTSGGGGLNHEKPGHSATDSGVAEETLAGPQTSATIET